MVTLRVRQKSKTLGVHDREYTMPSEWSEVTLQQFMELMQTKDMNEIKLLSILSGLSEEFISNAPADAIDIAGARAMLFLGTPPVDEWKMPTEVLIGESLYKVPQPEQMTFGQKVYLQEAINNAFASDTSVVSLMPYALAVYMYPIVTGEKVYTDEKIREFIPVVMRMRATEAVPVANFFFRKFIGSLKGNQKRSTWSQLRKKLMRELGISKSSE